MAAWEGVESVAVARMEVARGHGNLEAAAYGVWACVEAVARTEAVWFVMATVVVGVAVAPVAVATSAASMWEATAMAWATATEHLAAAYNEPTMRLNPEPRRLRLRRG